MLSSVFGGVILGAGIMIMRGGATTGGTDLLARVVHKKFPAISTGAFLFALDFVVIILAWIFMSAQHAMYAIICVYISARSAGQGALRHRHRQGLPHPLRPVGEDRQPPDEGVGAGSTHPAHHRRLFRQGEQDAGLRGGRLETMQVESIVDHEDPFAFVYITDAHETLGEGFRKLSGEDQARQLPIPLPHLASPPFQRHGGPGCHAQNAEKPGQDRACGPCLPVLRQPRHRQDQRRPHHGACHQLRKPPGGGSLPRMRELQKPVR